MDSTIEFYNNLFMIEIAVFGIIAAAIFVFVQVVYSQFSYREVINIFKNGLIIGYLFLSTITLIFTAIGSLLLSFPKMVINVGVLITEEELKDISIPEFFTSCKESGLKDPHYQGYILTK